MRYKPEDYVWIEKWLSATGSFPYYITAQQRLAADTDAPLDAIHYSEATKHWHTTDDIVAPELRAHIGLPPLPPMPSSFEELSRFDPEEYPPGFALPDPEMPETSNSARATFAAHALAAYAKAVHQEGEDVATNIGDLLSDLRHFCDGHGLDFAELDERGRNHYAYEAAIVAGLVRTKKETP